MSLPNPYPLIPIAHPLNATVRVPGSKSLTNRALAIAALADGTTTLTNALESDDSRHFVESLRRLGFDVQLLMTDDCSLITVHGLGGRIPAARAELFVGNAGTAARFLTAFVTLGHGEYLIDGVERMRERPIADLLEALHALGAQVESVNRTGCPPVRVVADGLPGGTARVAGDTSSQFLSAVLLVAPYARGPVEIVVERGLNSKPYVDMTIAVMADFGVTVERDGYERFCVTPQRYRARADYAIESDASAASYFFAAPAILGGRVRVEDISRESKQGDVAFLDVLVEMGCSLTPRPPLPHPPAPSPDREKMRSGEGEMEWIDVTGPPPGELRGVDVDMRDIPDTAQTLAAIAPFANSPTTIRGIASARVKETDRVAAMCAELRRLGVEVEERPDGLVIQPCNSIRPAIVRTYNDHRMAMAFALIGLKVEGIEIENPGCVAKTFPGYWEVVEALRR